MASVITCIQTHGWEVCVSLAEALREHNAEFDLIISCLTHRLFSRKIPVCYVLPE